MQRVTNVRDRRLTMALPATPNKPAITGLHPVFDHDFDCLGEEGLEDTTAAHGHPTGNTGDFVQDA